MVEPDGSFLKFEFSAADLRSSPCIQRIGLAHSQTTEYHAKSRQQVAKMQPSHNRTKKEESVPTGWWKCFLLDKSGSHYLTGFEHCAKMHVQNSQSDKANRKDDCIKPAMCRERRC
jgi:hypothetical protein